MSVASKNPFQLLGDDGAEAAPAAPAKAQAPAQPKEQRYVPGAPRPATQLVETTTEDPMPPVPPRNNRARSERGRGRGGERGGRGRGGKARGRQFDRHSGTGREETEKSQRLGQGGLDGASEVKNEEGAKADAKADAKNYAKEDQEDAAAAAAAARAAEEEEAKTLTLDQYLASQKEKREKLAAPAAPRELEADEQSYGQKLERNENLEYFAGQGKKAAAAPKAHKTKQTIEFEPRYDAPQPSRGGRSDRGRGDRGRGGARGRGDRGRGGARGSGRGRGAARSSGPVVNLKDESAFPSLG